MKHDPAREHRIDYEIVVDCYDELEVAAGWHSYLDDHLIFPFEAKYQYDPKVAAVQVTVLELDDLPDDLDADDELEFFVEIVDAEGDEIWVPLEQIIPLEADEDTLEAVLDWHYWKKHRS
jgi:hypothetical protein